MGRGLLLGLIWGALIMVVAVAVLSLTQPLPERDAPIGAASGQDPVPVQASLTDAAPDQTGNGATGDGAPASGTAPAGSVTDPAPAVSAPASEIPLPAGSEFNRPPVEEEAALPGVDASPASAPSVLTDLSGPVAPPQPNTTPAPQPAATASLQAPSDTGTDTALPTAPVQGNAPAPAAPAEQPTGLVLPTVEADPEAETTPATAPTDAPAGVPTDAPAGVPLQRLDAGQDSSAPVSLPDTPAIPASDLPAIEAFAAPFDGADGRPMMAVILIDDPSFTLGRDALTRFNFPVTFAIDPTREDAGEAAQAYRTAGFEVVLLADGFAAETDEDGALARITAGFAVLDQAVAVLDSPSGALQSNRPVLEAVVDHLAETGHGLVAYPRGLNVAEQTATRARVPAQTLFREIDTERERATVITRYLDRAAFAAGQEGQVIVVGHTYSDTVTALFSWALGSRSEGVALAPLSAVLTR